MILFQLFFASQMVFAAPRTVMVQMFEWNWKDIAQECEQYLGPNGFSAVQTSPPQEHISLGQSRWWERYQPVSYQLISRSGNEAQFKDMVARCKASGVDIYADVVMNHMATTPNNDLTSTGTGFGGSKFSKYNYPGLYQRQDFHDCGRNGNDQLNNFKDRYEVQFCELLGMPDLRTESEYVRNTLTDYLNHLLDLGVAGFRLDAAKHIPADDIQAIVSRLKRPAYIVSETFIGADEPISINEYMRFGDVNFFQYAFDLGNAITSGALSRLPNLAVGYPESRNATVFVENHDLQRSNSQVLPSFQKDPTLYLLANVYMLTWPYGYPQVFSGYSFATYDDGPPVDSSGHTLSVFNSQGNCQAPWNCEHRLPGMAGLVRFRNETDTHFFATKIWQNDPNQLAFSRGNLGFVAMNRSTNPLITAIPTDLADGWYCNLLDAPDAGRRGHCGSYVQVNSGKALVRLAPNSAVVLLSTARGD